MLFLNIATGVILVLLGMRYLRKGIGLMALPLLSPIFRVSTFLIESQTIDDSQEPDSYLDPLLLQAPSLALNQAAREELRLMDEIKLMLRAVWMMIWGKNIRLVSKVEEHQKRLECTQEGLKDYLGQVSDETNYPGLRCAP
jgi:Na+/phosphate symporter